MTASNFLGPVEQTALRSSLANNQFDPGWRLSTITVEVQEHKPFLERMLCRITGEPSVERVRLVFGCRHLPGVVLRCSPGASGYKFWTEGSNDELVPVEAVRRPFVNKHRVDAEEMESIECRRGVLSWFVPLRGWACEDDEAIRIAKAYARIENQAWTALMTGVDRAAGK